MNGSFGAHGIVGVGQGWWPGLRVSELEVLQLPGSCHRYPRFHGIFTYMYHKHKPQMQVNPCMDPMVG